MGYNFSGQEKYRDPTKVTTKREISNLYHSMRVQAIVAVAISSTERAKLGNVFFQQIRIPIETEMRIQPDGIYKAEYVKNSGKSYHCLMHWIQ